MCAYLSIHILVYVCMYVVSNMNTSEFTYSHICICLILWHIFTNSHQENSLFLNIIKIQNLNAIDSKTWGTLNNISNLFLIVKAVNDDEEKDILTSINKIMGSKIDDENNTINPFENHRILFYQTEIGKLALIRQLKPQLHIDHDLSVCTKIAPHIRYVILNNNYNDKCSNSIQNMKIIQNIQELLTITIP